MHARQLLSLPKGRAIQVDVAQRNPQLSLGLRPHSGWGGPRSGAGRKPGPNPCVPHRRRAGVAARCPAHVTVKLRTGLPSLRSVALVRTLERSFAAACDRGDFRLVQYALQDSHAHLVVEAANARALGRGMMALASRVARAVNRVFGRRGRVLAERYHLHVLRTPREVRAALAYVLLNSRRHSRRVGCPGELDPASSGRWFDGWRWTPPSMGGNPGCTPIARARTWLLSLGWQRHGLIDPREVPGAPRRHPP
jgi:hypothetical protein